VKDKIKKNYIVIIIVLIFLIFPFAIPKEKITISNEDGLLVVSYGRITAIKKDISYETCFELSDVIGAELITESDFGNVIDGTKTDNCMAGLWNNEEYGDYNLYIYTASDNFIKITLNDDTTIVLGLEDTEMTNSFYEALEKYLSVT